MNKPYIQNYRYHAMLCCGKKCEPEGDRSLLLYMKSRLSELGLNDVRVNRAGCLGVCEQGPIMVVYPDGVWYCDLNKENIDQVIQQHFIEGSPVKELVFHISRE